MKSCIIYLKTLHYIVEYIAHNILPFNELLIITNEVTIHHKNIQTLLTEVYKNLNGLSPPIMLDLFKTRHNIYNLRNHREICNDIRKTVRYGTETVTYKSAQLWELLPCEIKRCSTLENFKERIKSWIPDKCPCRLCKTFITNLGFIDIQIPSP